MVGLRSIRLEADIMQEIEHTDECYQGMYKVLALIEKHSDSVASWKTRPSKRAELVHPLALLTAKPDFPSSLLRVLMGTDKNGSHSARTLIQTCQALTNSPTIVKIYADMAISDVIVKFLTLQIFCSGCCTWRITVLTNY